MERYDIGEIKQLRNNDIVYQYNDNILEEIKLISIKEEWAETKTYIFELEDNYTFFANGILVHNKGGL